VILSGNGIEHALMALGAQHVGIPSAAISPAYSLLSTDLPSCATSRAAHARHDLRRGRRALRPAIARSSIRRHSPSPARDSAVPGREVPLRRCCDAGHRCVDRAPSTGPDTVAKFLFTSGTTGSPKAVIQTQRMLCSNQEMVPTATRSCATRRRSSSTGRPGTIPPAATRCSTS
jgi:feruloyl-CoA synthase